MNRLKKLSYLLKGIALMAVGGAAAASPEIVTTMIDSDPPEKSERPGPEQES